MKRQIVTSVIFILVKSAVVAALTLTLSGCFEATLDPGGFTQRAQIRADAEVQKARYAAEAREAEAKAQVDQEYERQHGQTQRSTTWALVAPFVITILGAAGLAALWLHWRGKIVVERMRMEMMYLPTLGEVVRFQAFMADVRGTNYGVLPQNKPMLTGPSETTAIVAAPKPKRKLPFTRAQFEEMKRRAASWGGELVITENNRPRLKLPKYAQPVSLPEKMGPWVDEETNS